MRVDKYTHKGHLPTAHCETISNACKTNIKNAFLSCNIKETGGKFALHQRNRRQQPEKTYWRWHLPAMFLFSANAPVHAGGKPSACGRGWYPALWLAEIQRDREFQTVQHLDQVCGARWFEHFIRFFAILLRTKKTYSWMMSSRKGEYSSFIPCSSNCLHECHTGHSEWNSWSLW